MKDLLKKNQLMITALAIMIAVAGYLQFAGTDLGEEGYLPTSGNGEILSNMDVENYTSSQVSDDYDLSALWDLSEEDLMVSNDINSLDVDIPTDGTASLETPESGEIPGEAVFTSGLGVGTLSEAKLLKEQTRAKNKETLLEIINSAGLTDAQKQEAVDTMVEMTAIAEKETAAEILLEAKGFSDVIVSINEGNVDVVVNALELTDVQRAQIEDIVKRKAEVDGSQIVISTVVQ